MLKTEKMSFVYNFYYFLRDFSYYQVRSSLILTLQQHSQTLKQRPQSLNFENQALMNDLRLLYEYDKERKIINLEYKQITSLEPLIPVLAKFENLESLSLNGNRLKSLPNMDVLKNLAEIDLSSNLFSDCKLALKGLKSLPSLRHLIYTFKNEEQQAELKAELPNLERLNKKPLNAKVTVSKKVKKNQLKLQQKDLEQIGQVYDEIREIYKKSKYMVDKELMTYFDKTVDIIMADLSSHLSTAKSAHEADSSIITCRYGLIDMCFTKMITYFYHLDKSIALVLEKIHDYIAQLFKAMGQIFKTQEQRMDTDITKVKIKKEELYKNQIKRLKKKDQTSSKEIDYLEKKNNQMLRLLTQYGKNNAVDKLLLHGVMRNYIEKSPGNDSGLRQRSVALDNTLNFSESRSNRLSNQKSRMHSPIRTLPIQQNDQTNRSEQLNLGKSTKMLNVNQLKEVINDIYTCKMRQNKVNQQSGAAMQTMEEFMYTYLNQRYGLKSLTIEWAMSIVSGIKKYSSKEPEVAVFGKVLRNQIEENFHYQLKKLKTTFSTQIKKFKGGNFSNFEPISFNEAEQILLNCRYQRQTIDLIMPRLRQQFEVQGKVPQQNLQNAVLEHLIRCHEQELKYFLGIFRKSDRDENGIVNRKELLEMVENCGKEVDTEMLFQYIDPFYTNKLTFSWVYEMFSKDESYRELLKQPISKN